MMTEQELREIVFSCVAEHGEDKAREILKRRAEEDSEFMLAAARHGAVIVDALLEARTATIH